MNFQDSKILVTLILHYHLQYSEIFLDIFCFKQSGHIPLQNWILDFSYLKTSLLNYGSKIYLLTSYFLTRSLV